MRSTWIEPCRLLTAAWPALHWRPSRATAGLQAKPQALLIILDIKPDFEALRTRGSIRLEIETDGRMGVCIVIYNASVYFSAVIQWGREQPSEHRAGRRVADIERSGREWQSLIVGGEACSAKGAEEGVLGCCEYLRACSRWSSGLLASGPGGRECGQLVR